MGHDTVDVIMRNNNNQKGDMDTWRLSTVSMDSGISNFSQSLSAQSQSTHSVQSTVSAGQYSSSSSFTSTSESSLNRSASMKRRLEVNQYSLDQAIAISPELAHSVFIAGNVPESPLPSLRTHSVFAVQEDYNEEVRKREEHERSQLLERAEESRKASAVQESHQHTEVHHTTETLVTSASMESSQAETSTMIVKEQAAIAPTPTPRVSVKVEKIESSALSMHYETEFNKMTAPVHQIDLDAASDDVVVIRQFDFAPSPVKWIKLYTSQEDPPAEIALKVTQTVAATCILMKEEEEGSFEEGWEEVVVQHFEEEVRKRVEHKRSQLLERIEQSRKTEYYSYGHRRRYDMISLGSPYSPRNIESPYPMHSFQTV